MTAVEEKTAGRRRGMNERFGPRGRSDRMMQGDELKIGLI